MGDPARKIAFHKPTSAWVIVESADDGKWNVAETLDEDPGNWTGEAYDLATASEKASAALKPQLEWYRQNMIDEPSGPIDENGKTTEAPVPLLAPASTTAAAPTPSNDSARAPTPTEGDVPWSALARMAGKKIGGMFDFGGGGPEPTTTREPFPAGSVPSENRAAGRGIGAPLVNDWKNAAITAGQGFTLRAGDEMAADAAARDANLWPQEGTPNATRAAARGASAPLMTPEQRYRAVHDETLRGIRQSTEQARAESPVATAVSEGAAALPLAVATAPVFGTAAPAGAVPWSALAARNAAQGAVLGGIAGGAGSEGDSRLSDAAMGAGAGAAGGAVGTGLAYGSGRVMTSASQSLDDAARAIKTSRPVSAVRDYAGNLADRARVAGTGAYGGQLKQITKNEGFDFTDRDLGQAVERLFPPKPGPLGIPIPRTARGYAKLAGPKRDELGQAIDDALRQMDDQGVSAPVRPSGYGDELAVVEPIDSELAQYGNRMRIGDDDKIMRGALRAKRMDALAAAGDNERLTPTQLAEMKRSLEGSGYASEATRGLPAGVQREANRVASSGPREALRDAAEKQALPETLEAWQSANRDYPIAKMIAEISEGRAAQEQGNQIVSLPSAIAGTVSGPAAAPGMFVWEMAKRYGGDATANAMRGVQRSLTPAIGPKPAIALPAQEAVPAAGSIWGALARRGQPAMAQPAGEPRVEIGEARITKREDGRGNAETSMGHNVQQQVAIALRAYPNALGPFKAELKAAAGDPVKLSAAISDAMQDPRWAKIVQPQLDEVDEFRRKKEAGQ